MLWMMTSIDWLTKKKEAREQHKPDDMIRSFKAG